MSKLAGKISKQLKLSGDTKKVSVLVDAINSGLVDVMGKVLKSGLGKTIEKIDSLSSDERKSVLQDLSNLTKLVVKVRSPIKLPEQILAGIRNNLENVLGEKVEIEEVLDKTLIAGVVLETNKGLVIDRSLKKQLKNLT
ncbi:MAG: hypothetical protein Fur0024_3670 [Patescibacteria group bacterium]